MALVPPTKTLGDIMLPTASPTFALYCLATNDYFLSIVAPKP